MEAFVEGRIYDTSRATALEIWGNGRTDARWYSETLYREKADGAFFLHAKGAPLSRYSEIRSGISSGREAILPMSRTEAERWIRSLPGRHAL